MITTQFLKNWFFLQFQNRIGMEICGWSYPGRRQQEGRVEVQRKGLCNLRRQLEFEGEATQKSERESGAVRGS